MDALNTWCLFDNTKWLPPKSHKGNPDAYVFLTSKPLLDFVTNLETLVAICLTGSMSDVDGGVSGSESLCRVADHQYLRTRILGG